MKSKTFAAENIFAMKVCKQLIAALVGAALAVGSTQLFADPPQGGGYGMGPGMMGGYGPGTMGGYSMGPGMMSGGGMLGGLNLADDQRRKIDNINHELQKKNWELGGKMLDEQYKQRGLQYSDRLDIKAMSEAHKRMQDLEHQQYQARLEAREKIDAVLTKEQKEQLRQFGGTRGMH